MLNHILVSGTLAARESGEYSFQFSNLERQWKIATERGNLNSATFADYEIASLEFLVPIPRPPTSPLENSPETDMLSPPSHYKH